MACKFQIESTGEDSELYLDMVNYLDGNEEAAELQYLITFTPEFKEFYGDWENPNMSGDYLNIQGEPRLQDGGILYSSKDGTSYHIRNEKFSDFSSEEVSEIVSQLAFQVVHQNDMMTFGSDISDHKVSIHNTIDSYVRKKEAEAKAAGDTELLEKLELIYTNNIHDFREAVIDYLEDRGIDVTQKREDLGDSEEDSSPRESKDIGITESARKNPKDTATANTKLLLSFIPKVVLNDDGRYVYETGPYLGSTKFEELDQVWNLLQSNLSNIVSLSTETEEVTDMFDSMLEKVAELSVDRPSIAVLRENLEKLEEWQKTQFVQAFSLSKYDYITTMVSGPTGQRTFKIGNSQNFSASDILINAWTVDFEESQAIDRLNSKLNRDYITKNNVSNIDSSLQDTKLTTLNMKDVDVKSLRASLAAIGITINDKAFKNYLEADKEGNINPKVFKDVINDIHKGFQRLEALRDDQVFDTEGNMMPVLSSAFGNSLKEIAEKQAKFEPSLTEFTVLGKDGNQFWEYSKPSMMHSLLNQIKNGDYSLLDELLGQPYSRGSKWLNHLDKLRREDDKAGLEAIRIATFLQFKEESKNDQGEDSKGVSMPDLLSDVVNKTLNFRRGTTSKKDGGHSAISNMMTAADKGMHHQITGMPAIRTLTSGSAEKGITMYNEKEVLEVFKDYLKDELRRYAQAFDELSTLDKKDLVLYYHTDSNGSIRDKKGNLAGNAFKIHAFPNILSSVETLLNKNGKPFVDSQGEPTLPNEVDDYILEVLTNKIFSTYESAKEYHIITEDGRNNSIDKSILSSYETATPVMSAIADFTVNSLMANIEGTKMFNGDPGYYKSNEDFLKRIPASYINGLTLRLGKGDKEFKVAVLDNIKNPSLYIDTFKAAFEAAGHNKQDVKDLITPYAKVNLTDAQGYVTYERYAFLMRKLGKTDPEWERIYAKATTKVKDKWETLTVKELKKLSAQPLKGVYFGQKNGMPTYLKYSQAVLWPSFIEGSPLQSLADKMTIQDIDEAVVVDGIKVGLVQPVNLQNAEGEFDLSNVDQLNTITLDNRNWRLQQDLPSKGLHNTLLGSQIQKNILANIDPKSLYGTVSGGDMITQINSVVSKLSDKGAAEVLKSFKVDKNGNIDKSMLDKILIEELKAKGGADNLINAIERNIEYDALFQHRDKIQNVLFSHINKKTVDITTNGGSFIQMSAFGINRAIGENIGVKWLIDTPGLKPPLPNKDPTKNSSRGQVLMPHALIVKAIPNYRNIPLKDLKAMIDPEVLKIVGYRIPNQGMSSNDALEIVGILPPEMGDTIVAYDEITTKTGSDFDIDKMYIMVPHIEEVKGRITTVKDANSKKGLQNELINLYDQILTDPKTYAALMSSIDATYLKDDIDLLHPNEEKQDLDLFDSIKQLELKVNLMSGKSGVGLTANQLADHPLTQIADVALNEYLGIGNTNSKNNSTFANIKDENGDKDITTVVSAFLNAYVDIAKDPYIVKGNHNTFTANVVFMLLRAGATYEWVNAFIGQPILKEYATQTFNSEGRMSISVSGEKGGFKSSSQVIKDKYLEQAGLDEKNLPHYKDLVPTIKDAFSLDALRNMIKDPNSTSAENQLNILTIFEGWKDISKSLTESVLASKNDVSGAGHDVIEKQIVENRKFKVLNDAVIVNFANKFSKDGVNTALGSFYDNSVGLANLMTQKLFISDSKGFRRVLNEMSTEMGRGVLTNREIGKTLEKEIFAYLYAQTNLHVNEEDIIPLFRDKSSIAQRTFNLQNNPKYKNNPLIKALQIKKGHKKIGYSYVTISNTKAQPKYFKNLLYKGWLDLLSDPEQKGFANDLVKYSYYSSGFKKGIGTIFEHVPNEWIFGNMVNDRMKDWKFELQKGSVLNNLKDQVYRHKWKDSKIVPNINLDKVNALPKNISANNAGMKTNMLFTIPEFVGTYKKNGQWPRFVTMKDFDNTYKLYKLMGTVKNEKGQESSVYIETHKLGYSNKGKSIVEYAAKKTKSIFNENNISADKMSDYKKSYNFVYDIVTPPRNVTSNEVEVDAIVIDYQKILRDSEEQKNNCK
jgi:hypothetical protein